MKKLLIIFILLLFSCSQEDQSMKNCIKDLQTKSIIKNGNEMKINKEIAIKYCNLFDESFPELFKKNKGVNLGVEQEWNIR